MVHRETQVSVDRLDSVPFEVDWAASPAAKAVLIVSAKPAHPLPQCAGTVAVSVRVEPKRILCRNSN